MNHLLALILGLGAATPVFAQAVSQPGSPSPPTLDGIRKDMGIPSTDDVRGQRDTLGYASRADQMALVDSLSRTPPAPEAFGPIPAPGVAAVLCPHDDYLYAGRVYDTVLPLVTARTVLVI